MIALIDETSPVAMKRRIFLPSLLLLSLLGSVGAAWAQGRWHDLPPEERRQMRQEMRDHWQRDRDLRGDDAGPRRWHDVSPGDRRRMREEMREQRAGQHERERRPRQSGD